MLILFITITIRRKFFLHVSEGIDLITSSNDANTQMMLILCMTITIQMKLILCITITVNFVYHNVSQLQFGESFFLQISWN